MKLQLTTIDDFYTDKEDTIFLGEWCFDSLENTKNFKINNYHYKNLEEVFNNTKYCYKVFTKIVPIISPVMNQIHNKEYDTRYWEILLGPWLWFFICVTYDRYLSLSYISKKYEKLEVIISDKNYTFDYFIDQYSLIQDDFVNYLIFSQIIKEINFNFKVRSKDGSIYVNKIDQNVSLKGIIQNTKKQNINIDIKYLLKFPFRLLNSFKKFMGTRQNKFININMPLGGMVSKNLYKELNQYYYYENLIIELPFKKNISDTNLRDMIIPELNSEGPFLSLLGRILFKNIPKEYLENYHFNQTNIQKYLNIKIPSIIGVRHSGELRSELRFLISEYSRRGSKIISCQEGGGKGARKICLMDEKIDAKLSDCYLTWGYDSEIANTKKFYFTKLFWLKKYNYNKHGNIVILGASCRKFFFSYYSGQLPSYNKKLLSLNSGLIKNINKENFNKLVYRFHHQMGYKEIEFFKKKFPALMISTREQTSHFYDLFFKSSLMIITTDFTTIKQSFVCNHPTILFWDKEYFEVRDSGIKYYELLHDSGILYYDSKKCAIKINQISDDPMKWWMSDEVQRAKDNYLENYGRISDKVEVELAEIIKGF